MAFFMHIGVATRRATCILGLVLGLPVTAQSEDFSKFTRHAHGWTIEYPSDWEVNATNPNYVKFSRPEKAALCGVHSGNTRWVSIDEVWDFLRTQDGTQVRPGGPINHIVDHERIKARPEVVGIRVSAELVPGGTSLSSYFIHSGHLIGIDCETYNSNWQQVSQDYHAILESVSFEKTQAAIAYEEGVVAWQSGTEIKAFEHFYRAAEGGDARAQYSVGIMLGQGLGTDAEPDEAITWLRRAAEQGILEAQVAFWQIRAGAGVLMKEDRDEVYKWQRLAAENGHTGSQFELGMRTLYGRGATESKTKEALIWLLKAARQGHPRAQHEAGAIFLDGDLALNDNAAAYGWLSLAVENGYEAAAELKEKASSLLSSQDRIATDSNVKMCLDTHYRECDF